MSASVIVWDIETVPDLRGFAAAKGLVGKSDDEVRTEMGDKFPKLIFHSIVCIGAVVAQWQQDHWEVLAVGAPHIGDRSEKEIIQAFVKRIADLSPRSHTFWRMKNAKLVPNFNCPASSGCSLVHNQGCRCHNARIRRMCKEIRRGHFRDDGLREC